MNSPVLQELVCTCSMKLLLHVLVYVTRVSICYIMLQVLVYVTRVSIRYIMLQVLVYVYM